MAALRESRGHLSLFLFPRVYKTSLEAKQEFQSKKENGCCVVVVDGENILRRSKFWPRELGRCVTSAGERGG